MASVSYRPQARLDVKEVYRRIAEFNPAAAAGIVRQIDQKAHLLAVSPLMGQGVPNLAPRLRRFPIGNYLIFYQPDDRGVQVVRVLHGARDIDSLFSDDPY